MMNKIFGFKAFNSDFTDNYGNKYELLKEYHYNGNIKFQKGGFHFCSNIEDIFRYYDSFNNDLIVTFVSGYGKIDSYNDEYNDYYDMYASEYLKVLKILTREEIIDLVLHSHNILNICRFISLYKLNKEEIDYILSIYKDKIIKDYISYYQYNDKETFERKRLL